MFNLFKNKIPYKSGTSLYLMDETEVEEAIEKARKEENVIAANNAIDYAKTFFTEKKYSKDAIIMLLDSVKHVENHTTK